MSFRSCMRETFALALVCLILQVSTISSDSNHTDDITEEFLEELEELARAKKETEQALEEKVIKDLEFNEKFFSSEHLKMDLGGDIEVPDNGFEYIHQAAEKLPIGRKMLENLEEGEEKERATEYMERIEKLVAEAQRLEKRKEAKDKLRHREPSQILYCITRSKQMPMWLCFLAFFVGQAAAALNDRAANLGGGAAHVGGSREKQPNALQQWTRLLDRAEDMIQDGYLDKPNQFLKDANQVLDRLERIGPVLDPNKIKDASRMLDTIEVKRGGEKGEGCFHYFVSFCLIIWLLERCIKLGRYLWKCRRRRNKLDNDKVNEKGPGC